MNPWMILVWVAAISLAFLVAALVLSVIVSLARGMIRPEREKDAQVSIIEKTGGVR